MATEGGGKISKASPMKGGDGVDSYANNSYIQRSVIDNAKKQMIDAVAENLDFNSSHLSNTFRIADLGCSVGPNTFVAVQNIIEAVQCKCEYQGFDPQLLEFQVFFNDHTSNDFNTLFTSIPPEVQYYAASVAGSFYSRLFPNASLHFVHSSNAISWLSRVPKSVVDKSSPAWNKGRIYISDSADEVVKAYEAQNAEDMECFLQARAQEVVCEGLIALIITGRPDGALHSQTLQGIMFDLLGSCLMDMAKRMLSFLYFRGIVSEEKVDSFNVPTYFMSPQELVAVVNRNGEFSIERMETMPRVTEVSSNLPESQIRASHLRAAMDGLIKEHLGM